MPVIDILAVQQSGMEPTTPAANRTGSGFGLLRALGWKAVANLPAETAARPLQARLEQPIPGTGVDLPCFQVKGWAYSPESPVEFVDLECAGRRLQRLRVALPRPDVLPILNNAPEARFCGFNGLQGILGLPPEACVDVIAVRKDRSVVPFASIQIRHGPVRTMASGPLQPLMIHALGRSGTTWVMRLLGEHPAITVAGGYPYEVRYGQCWFGLIQVVSSRINLALTEGVLNQHHWAVADARIADNPWSAAERLDLGQNFLPKIAARAQAQVEAYYHQQAQSQGKPRPAYFAEKVGQGQTGAALADFYPGLRDLFLVRDFRDVFCSVLSFNDKRHYQDFGRQRVTSDEDYIRLLTDSARRLWNEQQQRRQQSYLLRYEDLILQPEATLRALLQHLQLDSSPALIAGMLARARQDNPEMRNHRTSSSPEQSVGRWRTQLPEAYRATFQELMGDLLQAFGYEDRGKAVA
jgi:hypothetical protein